MLNQKLKYWLIPQAWCDLWARSKKIEPTQSKNRYGSETKIQSFKDKHKGERCFILASGPSIAKQDLTPLKDEHCIAVSQFFLHPDISKIRPEYHCFAPQHPPFDDKTNKIIFNNYQTYYDFPVQCFIGTTDFEFSYYNFLKKNPQYDVDACFIDYNVSYNLDDENFQKPEVWDLTCIPFTIRTVIYEAIQLAYYMGFKEIYLLGVDHDYLNDIGRTNNHHFYDDSKSFSDENHLNQISREEWFLIYYTRWKQYRLMKTFLSEKNVKIFNASPGSVLDVFPQVELESLINENSK